VQSPELVVPAHAIPRTESSIRAILAPMAHAATSAAADPQAFIITAGTDRKIQFWDLQDASKSFTMSGSDPNTPKSIFRAEEHHGIKFWVETKPAPVDEKTAAAAAAQAATAQMSKSSNAAAAVAASLSTSSATSSSVGQTAFKCVQ